MISVKNLLLPNVNYLLLISTYFSKQIYNSQQYHLIATTCDMLATLVFIAFLIFVNELHIYNINVILLNQKYNREAIKLNNYAIEVSNFPEYVVDASIIHQHFLNLNLDVQEVKLARNYYGSLKNYLGITEIRKKIKYEEAIVTRLFS